MARVGKVEDSRTVGVADLEGRDSIVAGARRRVFEGTGSPTRFANPLKPPGTRWLYERPAASAGPNASCPSEPFSWTRST